MHLKNLKLPGSYIKTLKNSLQTLLKKITSIPQTPFRPFSTLPIITTLLIILTLTLLLDGLLTLRNFGKYNPSVKVYDINDNLIYESILNSEGYQSPIKSTEISEKLKNAVITLEDKRFYSHFGIDPIAIIRALQSNISVGHIVSGGSTITQQVAKDSLFHPSANKYLRKIREANSALFLELFHTKEAILEYYLNSVYLGNMRYGVEAASQYYFNKSASDLSTLEASLLAGMISSPEVYDPISSPEAAKERRNHVLSLLAKEQDLSAEDLETLQQLPLGVFVKTSEDLRNKMHFIEYALAETDSLLADTQQEGLRIYTTLDPFLAHNAWEQAYYKVKSVGDKHKLSNSSVVILRNKDSAILTMVGSIDYFDEEIDGSVNVATSLRQPGSALKPITYGQAFYEGVLDPEGTILDEKTVFVDKEGKSFVPHNYNGVFNGEVPVHTALASSLNLPAVKVLDMVGVADMVGAAQRLGLHNLNHPERYGLSVTLGGGEVTLLNLTNAYASLGRDGYYKKPYFVRKVLAADGSSILYERPGTSSESMAKYDKGTPVWGNRSTEVSNTLFSILSNPSAKVLGFGRNNVLVLPFNAASKTGTTTDWHDNWTLGYTKDYPEDFAVGVWVGNTDNAPMSRIDGVTGAGPIWREVMLTTYDHLNKPLFSNSEYASNSDREEPPSERLAQKQEPEDISLSEGEQNKPAITNPPQNSTYYLIPGEETYEKLEFEVQWGATETSGFPEEKPPLKPDFSGNHSIVAVEFILNEQYLGKLYKEDSKNDSTHFLWDPQEGTFTLEANFINSHGETISKDTVLFQVHSPKP
ncbi:hypothetical protein GF360_04285 [candidate division WWE3 bacterium]|nr:hypothetical protein [candidate division WWE3 bacterium]